MMNFKIISQGKPVRLVLTVLEMQEWDLMQTTDSGMCRLICSRLD